MKMILKFLMYFSNISESTTISFVAIVWLCSCQNQPQSELYLKDKAHIEKSYISNTEATRRILLSLKDGFYLGEIKIPDSIPLYSEFCPIDSYWDDEKKTHFAIPAPAWEYLDVNVESISYSVDSLKCMALVTVYDKSDLYISKKKKECTYAGYAVIGIRNSKNEQFKIYPESLISFYGFPSRKQTLRLLKREYYHLKGDYTPGSGVQYTCGINNPEFFETAHEFSRIDSLDLLWCQTHMISGGRRRPYVFYSNQDSTITKYLCGDPEPEKLAD